MAWYDEYLSHDVWPGTAPEPEAPRDRVAEILRAEKPASVRASN